MSSWIDIVKKTPNNVSDKKVITVVTNVNTPLINNGPNDSLVDNEEKIKKTTKSLTRDKIQQIIAYRTANKLKQDTFAGLLSVPFPDIKNAENGNEINLTSYNKIFNYLEKKNKKIKK